MTENLPSTAPVPLVRRAPSLEPPTEVHRTPLRLVPRRPGPAAPASEPPARPVRLPVDPAARVGAARILQLALEVHDGRRSPQQLRAVLPAHLVDAVTTRARVASTRRRHPARLRQVHVQAVTSTVAEANALVERGPHAHAVAARMELVGRTWRCTALWLG